MKMSSPFSPIALAVALSVAGGCSKVHTNSGAAGQQSGVETVQTAVAEPVADNVDLGPSLVSLAAGAIVVKRPSEWALFQSAFNLIDERPASIWASALNETSRQTIVIALAERTALEIVEFDSGSAELQFHGCSANEITVEMSDTGEDARFLPIARVSLADRANGQRFRTTADVPGRWVRLTIENNHGSKSVTELGEFRAYGRQLTHTPFPDVTGIYEAYMTGEIHFKQEGSSIAGCYETLHGRITGGVSGHVFTFTWIENTGGAAPGHGVMVFTPDASQFASLWWGPNDGGGYGRLVIGSRKSVAKWSCPDSSVGVGGQIASAIEASGRATLYGINFDTDSDTIKEESKPALDTIASMLESKPEWKVTIEGHTDSISTDEHNRELSERRARAVCDYLKSAGADAARLTPVGYGASRPVSDNDTELGRAQNRRVELARE